MTGRPGLPGTAIREVDLLLRHDRNTQKPRAMRYGRRGTNAARMKVEDFGPARVNARST
ncbi:hypothetical protein [Streptomyces rhizosphaerihabitans]|uniref:hypothetical protein n=1 Tax=Streptomyces rhizosphaerihabitans TaxID=1266770 RepID=UPI0021BF0C0A|nr:hypothetical protein [Streptomyces rhizosphaerihabitans]MCT9006756.1 hypothetical protein [Streptomyces rhizosphaerihabitans]